MRCICMTCWYYCMQDKDAITRANRKASSPGFRTADCAFCAALFP